ncbi:unnamed protein product [Alternaria alternata]
MTTMKQVVGFPGPEVKCRLESAPIPKPANKQVLIKVVVSGSNPKDWKSPSFQPIDADPANHGDDIAGIVEEVGKDVLAFKKKGDRVAAFHEMLSPGGSFAEYALAWDYTTFHIPASKSFEEAATIPLAALTAVVSLFFNLELPTPWLPAKAPTPLVIYGASTAVGSYAIKLAQNSNIHPIIAIAGKGTSFVETLLDRSKGDAVFDYRKGADVTVKGIREHLKTGDYGKVRHGLDPGIGEATKHVLTKIVAPDGAINIVLPNNWETGSVKKTMTMVGVIHNAPATEFGYFGDARDLGLVSCRWFTKAWEQGTFEGHPYEVKPGGLEAVEQALKDLKDGKNSATKYVFRIADTPGL